MCPLIHIDEYFRFAVAGNPGALAASVMVRQADDAVFAPPITIIVEPLVAQIHGFLRVDFAVFEHFLLPGFAARTVGLQKGFCGHGFSHEITFSALDALVPVGIIVRFLWGSPPGRIASTTTTRAC